MGHLDVPRLHFQGRFVANVGTANNNYKGVHPPPVDVDGIKLVMGSRNPAEFRAWLQEPIGGVKAVTDLDKHRHELVSGWNWFGDHGCAFKDAGVSSVALGNGLVTSALREPLVGAAVRLNRAVMVDLDPTSNESTQIFCEELVLSGRNGLSCRGKPSRFHSRWFNFRRNVGLENFSGASAVFQASIREPVFEGASPALDALRDAAEGDDADGLSVCFCVYAVRFLVPTDTLRNRYLQSEHPQNPGVGWMVGAIGPRRAHEPRSVTLGRHLVPARSPSGGPALGDALAVVDTRRGVVTLDLMSTFPEADGGREKADLGTAELRVRGPGDEEVVLGPVAYDRATYEGGGGIVEVPIDASQLDALADGCIELHTSGPQRTLLERELVVEADEPSVYLREGGSASVRLSARWRGLPAPDPVTLDVSTKGARIDVPTSVVLPPGQDAALIMDAEEPGVATISLTAPGQHGAVCQVQVRALPPDAHLVEADLTFELLYQEVLQYYDMLHPAMSACVMDLGDERNWLDRGFCAAVLARLHADFESFAYMPRTRDMSEGKRRLVERWCAQIAAGG